MKTATPMNAPLRGNITDRHESPAGSLGDHEGWLLSLSAAGLLVMALVMAFSITAPF